MRLRPCSGDAPSAPRALCSTFRRGGVRSLRPGCFSLPSATALLRSGAVLSAGAGASAWASGSGSRRDAGVAQSDEVGRLRREGDAVARLHRKPASFHRPLDQRPAAAARRGMTGASLALTPVARSTLQVADEVGWVVHLAHLSLPIRTARQRRQRTTNKLHPFNRGRQPTPQVLIPSPSRPRASRPHAQP